MDIELLNEIVRNHDNGDRISWKAVSIDMAKLGQVKSEEAWRALWRKHNNSAYGAQRKRGTDLRDLRRQNAIELEDQILQLIKRKRSIGYLTYTLKATESDIYAALVKLQLSGYNGINIWNEDGDVMVQNVLKNRTAPGEIDLTDLYDDLEEITFGVISDTHLGSKHEALDELNQTYKYFKEKGITEVFHVGDVSEGWYSNRPTSIFDLHKVGFTDQLNHIVDAYPKVDGITTYFITGNHDYTHMRNGFANIGEAISNRRDDMIYLGHNFAQIDIHPDVTLGLIHPTDGSTNTMSLKLQQIISKNQKRRSDIMLVGHYHKSVAIKYMGVYGYMVPSFQHQTPFMEDNNLTSDVGAMIFTVKVINGEIRTITTEYIAFE